MQLHYKQHFNKHHQAEIGEKKNLSNILSRNFCFLKIIHFLYPCYHPKLVGNVLKECAKKQVCLF